MWVTGPMCRPALAAAEMSVHFVDCHFRVEQHSAAERLFGLELVRHLILQKDLDSSVV